MSKVEQVPTAIQTVDIAKRLLGIIKAKKTVYMNYAEEILGIPKAEIILLIFDLIGNGVIEGEFNQDDTVFRLKE